MSRNPKPASQASVIATRQAAASAAYLGAQLPVSSSSGGGGTGDMTKAVYDPGNIAADAFDYNNFINKPTLATVATTGAYSDLTGKPSIPVLIASGTLTNVATCPILFTAGYRQIDVYLTEWIPVTDAVKLFGRVSTNGGVSYDSGASDYRYRLEWQWSGGSGATQSGGDSSFSIINDGTGLGNGAREGCNARISFPAYASTALTPRFRYEADWYYANDDMGSSRGMGIRFNAQDTDAATFFFSSGNIASGKYAAFGWP